jgi:hypothetical protein
MLFGILFSFYARYMSECASRVEGAGATRHPTEPVFAAISKSHRNFSFKV